MFGYKCHPSFWLIWSATQRSQDTKYGHFIDFFFPVPPTVWCTTLQDEASEHDPVAAGTAAHLVAHRKILAVLRAPADSAVQALVDVAVPLVRAVAAVVAAVAEAPLGDAAAVGAHEEGAVAQASWREESEGAGGRVSLTQLTAIPTTKSGRNHF